MKIKDFLGKKVYDSEAHAIGKVTDVEFEVDTFTMKSIEVGQGIVKKVTISIESIAKVGDSVFLAIPQEKIGSKATED